MPRKITSNIKKTNGDAAERIAEHFLTQQGYVLLERNFNSKVGEIDLIMRSGHTYVFVEVRYRANSSRGSASESVTHYKYQRCLKTAQYWLMKNNLANSQFQIDVVAIDGRLRADNITWLAAV
ncbi:YraN family protein [Marinomonas ostreistagni]|uniref:YraN family protein n=1 Tax=Marinomonas ostreistagni TaxID=359209 RepID=UPI001951F052|nr:YraN family protein [Marinomonas ostreistagni]MBM6549879.1 YraN family protein [Marinomonas ostreistagni]